MTERMDYVRTAMYALVIGAAATLLREPWMIALQAAAGGFALGAHLTRIAYRRAHT